MDLIFQPARIFFKKKDRCIYISHLDLTRAMSRAISRSGIKVWYTQGYHPHLYMTFALPLSLGTASLCESMDVRLDEDETMENLVSRLNSALPDGIEAFDSAVPVMEPRQIMWSDYTIDLVCNPQQAMISIDALSQYSEILMEKKSKKGMKEIDIRPMYSVLEQSIEGKMLRISLRCRAGVEVNLNPAIFLAALEKYEGALVIPASITRTAVWTEDFKAFN